MVKDEIEAFLRPVIEDLGYEFWGLEYLPQGKHSLLRLYIDKAEGIGVADCERVSRQVSASLDVEDPIPGHYSLEVSSPGIPRPLFHKEQYQRYKGQSIQLKLNKPLNGSRRYSGQLMDVVGDSFILKMDEEELELPFALVAKANLISY